MWVRIQDKTSLLEVSVIKADTKPNIEGKYVVWMPINIQGGMFGMPNVTAVLGEYSTPEQALQVLDEIQDRINEGCPFVYQMPEDEENKKTIHEKLTEMYEDYIIDEELVMNWVVSTFKKQGVLGKNAVSEIFEEILENIYKEEE